MQNIFNLKNRVVLITGGAGLLGQMHAEAIVQHGGTAVIADINDSKATDVARKINLQYNCTRARSAYLDVTDKQSIINLAKIHPDINVLINNAAANPVVSSEGKVSGAFETLTLEEWNSGLDVTLTGTFLCAQVFGEIFAKNKFGVIINISSDLGVHAPDQRIYKNGKKPITYSASKFAIVGVTKYLATYYADKNIRVNCISPGGVYVNQPKDFVDRLTNLIPMGRMARKDEYKGAIVFLCSDASSYMTGENIVMNGGRAAW